MTYTNPMWYKNFSVAVLEYCFFLNIGNQTIFLFIIIPHIYLQLEFDSQFEFDEFE